MQGSVRSYADALQRNEPDAGRLANLYGEIGQMRLHSSDAVVYEARQIAHTILKTYQDTNCDKNEIRDLLESDLVDLFSRFGDACRVELAGLNPHEAHFLLHLGATNLATTPLPMTAAPSR